MSSKAFTRQIFCWLRQVNHDNQLQPADVCVAVELSDYFNEEEGGRAWPGCRTIGDAIDLHEVTVLRSVRRLEAAGHLRVVWGRQGSGHSNQYWMIIKPAPTQVSEGEKPAPTQVLKPAYVSGKPAYVSGKPAPTQQNHLTNHPKNHRREKDSPPDDVFLGKKKEVAAEEIGEPTNFERFWRAFPKKKAKETARKAFEAAIKRGADPETLIQGAARYALERHGKPARWTKHPATWLNGGCWDDEPDGAVVVDEHGNEVAIEQEDEDEDDFETSFAEYQRMVGFPEDGSW